MGKVDVMITYSQTSRKVQYIMKTLKGVTQQKRIRQGGVELFQKKIHKRKLSIKKMEVEKKNLLQKA